MTKLNLFCTVFLVWSISFFSLAGKIEKGFERLEVYDYFNAKKYFEQSLKRKPSPAAYGLAIIYLRQDNPFHNIDSAYRYINWSFQTFPEVKAKHLAKWKAFGFTEKNLVELRENIAEFQFDQLLEDRKQSVDKWTEYITLHPEYSKLRKAIYIRDSLALEKAKSKNTSKAYSRFMEEYPDSKLRDEAQKAFYKAEYFEATSSRQLGAYVKFLEDYPKNPYRYQAEDKIYALMTDRNTVEDLKRFVDKFPDNRNVNEAWRRLYQVYMYDYSEDRIELFKSTFVNYPFMDDLEVDLAMSKKVLIPFSQEGQFGAMNLKGKVEIEPKYEVMGFFKEGLAAVSRDGKYGFINKSGEVVVPLQFDYAAEFENGRSVVEQGDFVGLIDRTGKLILEAKYEDIGVFSEQLIYAQLGGKYGYYDRYGELRIQHKYDEAYSFHDGIAKIEVGGKQGFINAQGDFYVQPKFDEITFFDKELFVVDSSGLKGIMTVREEMLVPCMYDEIGNLSNGIAMVLQDEQLGYIDSLGNLVIPIQFDQFPNCLELGEFRPFSALAKYEGKFGLIDRYGKFVIPNKYEKLGEFSTILAFNKGKLWGFIDLNNKVVIPPKYDWAESFKNGGAIVDKEGMQGVINISGEVIIPIDKQEILRIDPSRYQVQEQDRLGIYGADGEVIAPAVYSEIRQLNKDFYVMIKGREFDYLYLPENRIIRLNP